MDGPLGIDHDLRGRAIDVPATDLTSRDIEAERQRLSEIARIRDEIMDIARAVADLRRREPGGLAQGAPPNHGGPFSRQNPADREPQKSPAQAPRVRAPELRNRTHEQRPPVSNGRRHQFVERAHRNSRGGNADPATNVAPVRTERQPLAVGDDVLRFAPAKPKPFGRRTSTRRWSVAAKAALLTGVMLAGTGMITLALWGKLPLLAHEPQKASRLFADASAPAPEAMAAKQGQLQLAAAADQTSALFPFEMPDTYGVYAVGEGHLTALEPLPIRVPDARVAISSAISKPAPAPATNGTPLFIVYHRELATSVPENASVRVFAKVTQATTFVGGKSKPIAVEDAWAVRGGAIDLRIAPVAANKEMIMIRPADPNFTLSPGRYVLMFKNQAYDFSVAGTISDAAHCLERSDLQDKSVYSECRELPASTAKL